MRPSLSLFLTLLALCALPACGGGGGGAGLVGPAPSIADITPAEALSTGGASIVITGGGFASGVADVTIGGLAASDVVVEDDTRLKCTVPAGAPGIQDVAVRTAGGSTAVPNGFRYIGALRGRYGQFRFEGLTTGGRATGSDPARVAWGAASGDGMTGSIDSALAVGTSGATLLGVETSTTLYTSLPNARLEFGGFVGGISDGATDPDVIALASQNGYPGISLFVNRQGGRSPTAASVPATVAGEYTIVMFGHDGLTSTEYVTWGSLRFDGVGAVTDIRVASNAAGTLSPMTPIADGTYLVGVDRQIAVSLQGRAYQGVFLGAGELIVLGGPSGTAADLQAIAVLIPRAAAGTSGLLSGSYHFVTMDGSRPASSSPGGAHYTSALGMITADGAGELVVGAVDVINGDGSVSVDDGSFTSFPMPYAVALDGRLDVGPALEGAVSPDGRFAVLAGETRGPSVGAPSLLFLVRAP